MCCLYYALKPCQLLSFLLCWKMENKLNVTGAITPQNREVFLKIEALYKLCWREPLQGPSSPETKVRIKPLFSFKHMLELKYHLNTLIPLQKMGLWSSSEGAQRNFSFKLLPAIEDKVNSMLQCSLCSSAQHIIQDFEQLVIRIILPYSNYFSDWEKAPDVCCRAAQRLPQISTSSTPFRNCAIKN